MSFLIQTLLLVATATQFLVAQGGVDAPSGVFGRDIHHAGLPGAEVACESETEFLQNTLHQSSEPAGPCNILWYQICDTSDSLVLAGYLFGPNPRGPPA